MLYAAMLYAAELVSEPCAERTDTHQISSNGHVDGERVDLITFAAAKEGRYGTHEPIHTEVQSWRVDTRRVVLLF